MKNFNFFSIVVGLSLCFLFAFNSSTVYASNNLAANLLPSASSELTRGSNITDGIKDTSNYSDSTPAINLQWVQIDLGGSYDVDNIKLWHYFGDARVYHDVIVQLSNRADFSTSVTTVFNNDRDNSSGLGAGNNSEYTETSSGKDITFTPVNARYVRFYSNGSTANTSNHYVEIEIYGSPAEPPVDPPVDPPPVTSSNLASNSLPSSSSELTRGSNITDGVKDTSNYSDSTPAINLQWVQIDLGGSYDLDNIKLWHYFADARVYHDVIVQLSNTADFSASVTTVFNNDRDNSSGLGAGSNSEYTETSSGKDITFTPVNARYARFYSNGSTADTSNHYVEIEIYGLLKPLENSTQALSVPTYDGSNIAVHPSIQYFENGWNGYKYWMAYTPYPDYAQALENPSICVSNDGINWLIPIGLINPLVAEPPNGHNCDTEIFYNSVWKVRP